jgi:hypothetical protein
MATSITFIHREKCRANEIGGAVDLVRTETVHVDGLVEWSVKGTSDGEYVNKRGKRRAEIPTPLDLQSVTNFRLAAGWTVSL